MVPLNLFCFRRVLKKARKDEKVKGRKDAKQNYRPVSILPIL